jgi:hypothetical protein
VLVEFLDTFQTHHNIMNNSAADDRISLDEWTEYYHNVSSSIDDDDYFALMMNNSWNLKGNADPYQKYKKGWSADQTIKPD